MLLSIISFYQSTIRSLQLHDCLSTRAR